MRFRKDWDCATEAAIAAKARTGAPLAMVATLPELMPEETAQRLMEGGVLPLNGLRPALAALAAVQKPRSTDLHLPVALPIEVPSAALVDEANAKAALAGHGLKIPRSITFRAGDMPDHLPWTAALKGLGFAHKSEAQAVALNLTSLDAVAEAAKHVPSDDFLLEEMITDGVAELLIGVTLDPAHGYTLTLGAGGVLTELLEDTQNLLLPSSRDAMKQALTRLKCAKLLTGYRGNPPADLDAILDAIEALQSYVLANIGEVTEVEVNPLICTPKRAVAADALIWRRL